VSIPKDPNESGAPTTLRKNGNLLCEILIGGRAAIPVFQLNMEIITVRIPARVAPSNKPPIQRYQSFRFLLIIIILQVQIK
jgi:hypothetical protein